MNKEASNLLAKLVTEIYKNGQLQQKVNQLEEDYKNEVEENLKLSELWRKSQEEKRQLEANKDEAIEYLKYALDEEKETPSKHNDWRLDLLEILERGKK